MESGDLEKAPRGYKQVLAHIIFDVKLDYRFTREARFVSDGHKVDTSPSTTYASVVPRYSLGIILISDDLNVLEVQCTGVQKAYLNDKPKERVLLYSGENFGKDKGKIFIMVCALYGLKGTGSAWEASISQLMKDLDFKPFRSDVDVCMHVEVDTSIQGMTETEANTILIPKYVL